MRITPLALLSLSVLAATPARADLHITRDHGGYVEEYKAKYQRIRDRKERVIIDGICNSACTLVFGIVPMNKICVTPKASLGFHQAYYDKAFTFGIKVTSVGGDIGPDVLLSGHREGLDPPQWRADHRDEEDQERRRALEDRRSLPGRVVGGYHALPWQCVVANLHAVDLLSRATMISGAATVKTSPRRGSISRASSVRTRC